ncbi:MAG TPA: PAS domain-containing protein, partial [Rhodothermales bacterium]|nr:PAS domain-containing protein [Rhodothermales bacterium]
HAPPSLIVNVDHQVVHILGGGEAYLKFTPGHPTQDVLKVVREALRLELRTALYQAFRKAQRTRSRAVPVRVDGTLRQVELLVEPITEPGFADDYVHVLFREVGTAGRRPAGKKPAVLSDAEQELGGTPDVAGPSSLEEAEALIRQLEDELDHAKEQLHTTTEEHEAASEEMTAANEEMQSINEELRSTTEELETSKEELQSVNEELLALNQELKSKIEEINRVNSDLQNLMNATEIGTIFLDRHLRIKRYTPQVEDLFDIHGGDMGRPLAHIAHRLGSDALPDDAARVLRELTMIEREVQHTPNQQWFLVRLLPYHSVEGIIEGVVISFIDITEKKKYDEQLEGLIETLEELLATRVEQIKQLSSELVLSEQAERQRIAQILHDDMQQVLFALQIKMGSLSQNLSKEKTTRLTQATALIDRALDMTRTLTVELSPPVLKGEDITVTIDYLAIQMEDMHGLKVEVEIPGPVYLPADVRTLVYQLVRELLFNVVKHAGVDRARVRLVREKDRLVLLVEDEGTGFDMAAEQELRSAKQGGFGLRSVWERLHLFGGHLDMESAPGQGTRVTFSVSLENKADGV